MSGLADVLGRGGDRGDEPPPVRWITRYALPVALVATALALLLASGWSWLVPAPTVPGVPVLVEPIEVAASAEAGAGPAVQAAGWIEPSPFPSLATALAGGVVREIAVLEGERIARDRPIAFLVDDDARLEADLARAGLAERDAMVARAETELEAARVELRNLVASDRAIAVAEARLAAAEAARNAAAAETIVRDAAARERRDELERVERTFAAGGTSEAALVRLRLAVEAADAARIAADAKRLGEEAGRREAEAELDAARRERDLLVRERSAVARGEADLAAARAARDAARTAVAAAELRLARMTVRSPIDGIVLERLVAPGHTLDPTAPDGAAVASVYDPTSLQVRADVPNADLALVGIGMPAEITVEALPGRRIVGSVLRILHRADLQKNTVTVQVAIADPPGELRPDMLCRVLINPGGGPAGAASRQRLLAPRDSLPSDGTFALVAAAGGGRAVPVERRPIRLGRDLGDGWIEVLEGLRPGDLVLDARTVRAGQRVRVRPVGAEEVGRGR